MASPTTNTRVRVAAARIRRARATGNFVLFMSFFTTVSTDSR
jgi:hypothetical protein